ncbi:MAG: hypothetical protein AB7K36_01105, partial [Chloroflexota bacterium]
MANPFSFIDRLDFDVDLPPLPSSLGRADRWFNRLSEVQRIGVALMVMLFLGASSLYCLGLGSTVLVNRAEAAYAAEEARVAADAAAATAVPTPVPPAPTPTTEPTAAPTAPPATARPTTRPTQVVNLPTPIPAQLLPTVPLLPQPEQRSVAPAAAPARPRLTAPVEPPTPTPPPRVTAPAPTRAS